jgi:ppGpp synthetase/RelA/SpoT-type nucleotidyltranferase
MSDLEQTRKVWLIERPFFERFGSILCERLKYQIRRIGIYAEVVPRTKDTHSLIKKLFQKPHYTYESLPDKLGIRIIVRYIAERKQLLDLVGNLFDHNEPDDKANDRGTEKVGYLAVHLDNLRLKEGDEAITDFPPHHYFAEVQLCTQAQHLWMEMSHDSFYKNNETIRALPKDLQRRINLMAGQVEVADREFERIRNESPNDAAYEILQALERNYFKLTTRRPDPELSIEVIRLLLPFYGDKSTPEVIGQLDQVFTQHERHLEEIYQDPDKEREASAFFFQPEALMIYDRLIYDRDRTLKDWNVLFPPSELERVADNFGISLI